MSILEHAPLPALLALNTRFPPALVTQLEHPALLSKSSHRSCSEIPPSAPGIREDQRKTMVQAKRGKQGAAGPAFFPSLPFHYDSRLHRTRQDEKAAVVQLLFFTCSRCHLPQQLGSVTSKQALSNANFSKEHCTPLFSKLTQQCSEENAIDNTRQRNHMYNLTAKRKRQSCHQVCNTFRSTESLLPGTATSPAESLQTHQCQNASAQALCSEVTAECTR